MLRHLIFFCCIAFASVASAQMKSAHVNTGLLLESLPEAAVADSLLTQYQDSLALGFKALEEDFATKLTYLQQNQENLTPKQSQELQLELQELQQEAGVFQQESARMFEVRRAQYLQPLVDKVSDAISAYAKTNSINIVYDVAVGGVMVYADENLDITDEIKKALK